MKGTPAPIANHPPPKIQHIKKIGIVGAINVTKFFVVFQRLSRICNLYYHQHHWPLVAHPVGTFLHRY
jgi:hypothetical protein